MSEITFPCTPCCELITPHNIVSETYHDADVEVIITCKHGHDFNWKLKASEWMLVKAFWKVL